MEAMPLSLLRAGSVNRDFYEHASCRTDTGVVKKAWTAESGRRYKIGEQTYTGDKLIELALEVCRHCPVQHDCANAAIEAGELIGTWAIRIEDIRFLSKRPRWKEELELARSTGASVQSLVRMLRAGAPQRTTM